MFIRTLALSGLTTLALTLPALAEIEVKDAYARSSGPMAMAGAAFMEIVNTGEEDDQLIGAKAGVAKRVELHTHIAGDDGVMKMREVEDGFTIPAGGSHMLQRGGDHVMFMGLTETFEQGKMIPVTLVFEKAGEIVVEVPVDLERQDAMGHGKMGHGTMGDGNMGNGAMKQSN
ncbi:copper chaperone PCu(A)C [Pseudooceanicola sp. MF1-13]|uniref:copper chaperone PCu(A)C n=1 Tax=Pseudooceanicola sp. MF1-13 TaxID=3379095 RepID=UPI0038927318